MKKIIDKLLFINIVVLIILIGLVSKSYAEGITLGDVPVGSVIIESSFSKERINIHCLDDDTEEATEWIVLGSNIYKNDRTVLIPKNLLEDYFYSFGSFNNQAAHIFDYWLSRENIDNFALDLDLTVPYKFLISNDTKVENDENFNFKDELSVFPKVKSVSSVNFFLPRFIPINDSGYEFKDVISVDSDTKVGEREDSYEEIKEYDKEIKNAKTIVEIAESKQERYYVKIASEVIDELIDSPIKKMLNKRIEKIETKKGKKDENSNMQTEALSEEGNMDSMKLAKRAIVKAERTKAKVDIESARIKVEELEDSRRKEILSVKLQKIE